MDISTQDIAQPTTAAEVMAYTIDTKAEWRDARWWAECPWHADGSGEKRLTIWEGMDGPDPVPVWLLDRQGASVGDRAASRNHEQRRRKINVIGVAFAVIE